MPARPPTAPIHRACGGQIRYDRTRLFTRILITPHSACPSLDRCTCSNQHDTKPKRPLAITIHLRTRSRPRTIIITPNYFTTPSQHQTCRATIKAPPPRIIPIASRRDTRDSAQRLLRKSHRVPPQTCERYPKAS